MPCMVWSIPIGMDGMQRAGVVNLSWHTQWKGDWALKHILQHWGQKICVVLGYHVVTDWMPAFISLTVVGNSAVDNFFLRMVVLGRCRMLSSQTYLYVDGNNCCEQKHWFTIMAAWTGTLRHHSTPWHAVACLDPCWSFCIAIKIICIFHHNEQDGLLPSLSHVHLLLFLIVLWSFFLVRGGLRQRQPSEK